MLMGRRALITEKPTCRKIRMKRSGCPSLELHKMSHRFSSKQLGDRTVDLKWLDGSQRPGSEFSGGDYFDTEKRREEKASVVIKLGVSNSNTQWGQHFEIGQRPK